MKQWALAVAMVSVALTGCGGSECEDAVDTGKSVAKKAEACSEYSELISEDYTVAQCEEEIEGCSDDDQEKFEKWLDCMNALPTCTSGSSEDFGDAVFLCFSNMGELSPSCRVVEAESAQRAIASYPVSQ
ncbi:hypothetical protein [Hyalangium gracile]|uniref:hypothetical protein n=1 Tax=Hyalangium gracile TaxID=394092 RepID=UPI001CCD6C3B|nr:hypothetical protein [Hyalangium gracile]